MVLEKVFKIENAVIAGFLYSKLQEAEKTGIEVRYRVELNRDYPISEVRLVEAMGTLFDHAMTRLAETEPSQKKIYFKLKQKEEEVTIKFACTSKVLSVEELVELWSKKEKGTDLYKLKQLAECSGGKILVKMKAIEDVNYLCIKVKLPCKVQEGRHIFHIHKVDSL